VNVSKPYKNNAAFVCYDCIFVFQTTTRLRKKTPFCPNCGDNVGVEMYKADRVGNGKWRGIAWKDQEMEYLDRYIDGELEAHQVSIMTGRAINAIYSRGWQRKKERGIL